MFGNRIRDGASKHFHHYVQPTLNETNLKADVAVPLMEINDILNTEANKDVIAESVIGIAKECFRFGVKDAFVSNVTVNTQRSSAFIAQLIEFFKINGQRIGFILLIIRTPKESTSGKTTFV